MKHRAYCCGRSGELYEDSFSPQNDGDIPVFVSLNFQRVLGLGSIFGGCFCPLRPLVLPFVKTQGKKNLASAVKTGMQVADYMMEEQNFRQSAKTVSGSRQSGDKKRRLVTRRSNDLCMMSFVRERSCECTKSEFDLFSVPPTQTSMGVGRWNEYRPMTTVSDGSPIEFDASGSWEGYIDFANAMLYVKAKITQSVFPRRHFNKWNSHYRLL